MMQRRLTQGFVEGDPRVRSIRVPVALAAIVLVGCAAPLPPSPTPTMAAPVASVAPSPSVTPSPTPQLTPVPTPESTLPPIDGAYFDDGWTVVASFDDSGPEDAWLTSSGRVAANSQFEVAYACAGPSEMTIIVVDYEADFQDPTPGMIDLRTISSRTTSCSTTVRTFSGSSPDHDTRLSIEGSLTPATHNWWRIAVPDEDVIP